MFQIDKTFSFAASHSLTGLPEGHKCSRLHGHTYCVTVTVGSEEINGPGWVTDFADLKPFAAYIESLADHQHLNDVLDVNPTAENLAYHLAQWFIAHVQPNIGGRLESVRVGESPTSGATYLAPSEADTR